MPSDPRLSVLEVPCPVVGHQHEIEVPTWSLGQYEGKRLAECPDRAALARTLPDLLCDECAGIATWAKTHDGPITETCHRCGGTGLEPQE